MKRVTIMHKNDTGTYMAKYTGKAPRKGEIVTSVISGKQYSVIAANNGNALLRKVE